MTVRTRVLFVLCALAAMLFVGSDANALGHRKVTDEEMKAMTKRILALSKSGDDKEDVSGLLELARRVRPIVELVDAKCPMPVKVANGTTVPLFNVEVSVSERRGTTGTRTPQTFHIPYIPPRSVVSGTVECAIPSYDPYGTYGTYGSRDIYMSASPIAEHSRLDDEGIKTMVRQHMDASVDSYEFSAGSRSPRNAALDAILGRDAGIALAASHGDPAKMNMIHAALDEIESEDDFKFLVSGLLKNDEGAKQLGTFVAMRPSKASLSWLTPLFATAQPAKLRSMIEGALGLYDRRAMVVLGPAIARVCGAGSPETEKTSLWLTALGADVRLLDAREAILTKCGVGKDQMRARLRGAKPELLGRALDGMSGDMFDVALAVMTETKSAKAASTLLAATQNREKFDAVASAALSFATDAATKQEIVFATAAGGAGPLDEAKAKWVNANVDATTLRKIFGEMANGRIANAEVRKATYARWNDVGKAAFDPFMAALAMRSHVLDPGWVRKQAEDGKLDFVELLEKVGDAPAAATTDDAADDDDDATAKPAAKSSRGAVTSFTNTCLGSAKSGESCLAAVRFLALTKDAIDPKFVSAAQDFLRTSPTDATAAQLAEDLVKIGVDMSDVVDSLCKAASTDPGRWGYGTGANDTLNTAIALDANHPCIATVKSARTSTERWIAAGIGFRMMLAFVPFGFVALFAKKRFVPVRAQLAKDNAELDAVRGKAVIAERLETPKLGDAYGAALADAATFLSTDGSEEIAGAGRALANLAPEKRSAVLGRVRALASRAIETGAAATCLAELDGLVLYVACFPGRDDQPQTVRRHAGFTDGWPAHANAILDACVADGRPPRVLSLLFMLGTDASKTTMLVGFDSKTVHFVPESLSADDKTDRTHEHRYEIVS